MGAKTDYQEGLDLKAAFGSAHDANHPATWYIGLMSAVTDGETQSFTELSGGSYARAAVANTDAEWDLTHGGATDANADGVADDAIVQNKNAVTFPAPTADQGQAAYFGWFDAQSGGNLRYYAALTTPKTINNGDAAPSFAAGALTYQEDT